MPVALVTRAHTLARSELFDLYTVNFEVVSLVLMFGLNQEKKKIDETSDLLGEGGGATSVIFHVPGDVVKR